jgi:hypothetical protein
MEGGMSYVESELRSDEKLIFHAKRNWGLLLIIVIYLVFALFCLVMAISYPYTYPAVMATMDPSYHPAMVVIMHGFYFLLMPLGFIYFLRHALFEIKNLSSAELALTDQRLLGFLANEKWKFQRINLPLGEIKWITLEKMKLQIQTPTNTVVYLTGWRNTGAMVMQVLDRITDATE